MGHAFAEIELVNRVDLALSRSGAIGTEEVRHYRLNMLVDTGALMLTINKTIREVLGLPVIDHRVAQMADGTRIKLPVVGPVEIRFEDRFSIGNAYVLPGDSEPLLGGMPLEEMDVWINPTRNILRPLHPDGWVLRLK